MPEGEHFQQGWVVMAAASTPDGQPGAWQGHSKPYTSPRQKPYVSPWQDLRVFPRRASWHAAARAQRRNRPHVCPTASNGMSAGTELGGLGF